MYHRVSDPPHDPEEGGYVLAPEAFAAQVRWLAASGRAVVPLRSLADAARPDGSVVLTVDDGCDSDARVVAPLLESLGLTATFFVTAARVGEPGRAAWPDLRALAAGGFEVGAHGLDHVLFADLGEEALRRQLEESKRRLEDGVGRAVTALALPGGSGGERARRAARAAGYRLVVGSRPGLVRGPAPDRVLPRFAVRGAGGFRAFRHAVEQRTLFRLREGTRHATLHLAREALGTRAYGRLRARLQGRAAGG
jgi:peptidoglycan/xylan/chitin deacetylase (PgdA/CDA1 family)